MIAADRPRFTAGLRIVARLCRPQAPAMVRSVGLAIVATVLEVVPFGVLFVAVRDLHDDRGADASRLAVLAGLAATASGMRFVVWGRALRISHLAAFDMVRDLRLELARTLATLPLGWFTRRRSGEVQRTLTEDLQRLEMLVAHAVPELVSAVSFWLAASAWVLSVDWEFGLAVIGLAPVAFVVLWIASRDNSTHVRRVTAAADEVHAGAAEILGISTWFASSTATGR